MTEETGRKDFSTQAIAYRLVDYITRLHYLADHFLFAKQKNMPRQMEYGHSEKMRLQIQRMEHTVRCFILFLVTEFFAAKVQLPYEQKERQTHAPKTFDERSEEQQYDDLHGRPLGSFTIILPHHITPTGKGKKRGTAFYPTRVSGRRIRRLIDTTLPTNVDTLLKRIDRLTRVMKRADKIAERLAAKTLYQQAQLEEAGTITSDCAGAARLCETQRSAGEQNQELTTTSDCAGAAHLCGTQRIAGEQNQNVGCFKRSGSNILSPFCEFGVSSASLERTYASPLFYEPLTSWYPPAHLYEAGEEDEKSDIVHLHLKAKECLEKHGHPQCEPDQYILSIPPPAEPRIRQL